MSVEYVSSPHPDGELREYQLAGRTFMFRARVVPAGAKLVSPPAISAGSAVVSRSLTKDQLLSLAEKFGIDIPSKASKDEVLALLRGQNVDVSPGIETKDRVPGIGSSTEVEALSPVADVGHDDNKL